jgi:hypothetical protein
MCKFLKNANDITISADKNENSQYALLFLRSKSKVTLSPEQAEEVKMLRISHCLDNRLTDGGKVFSSTHRAQPTPQKHYFPPSGTHFC